MLALFGAGLATLLLLSPLNETPDTYCQTALRPASVDPCSDAVTRRWQWIGWVAAAAIVLAVLAWWLHRRSDRRPITPSRVIASALMLVGVGLAIVAAAYLTIGENQDQCGSTLSRVDEDGVYAPDRPKECAPSYASSQRVAWITGLVSLGVFAAGAVLEARSE